MNYKKPILLVALLIILMGSASAEQITEWPHGQRNIIPDNVHGVMYDFEEGTNCAEFNNQFPDVATFLTVLGTQPYGSDEPSYSKVGGSTCGNTRCYMNIWPYPNQQHWIYIVNGQVGFNPITGPDQFGGYWPGTQAKVIFKEETRYVSFLVSTGGTLSVRLYDPKGNTMHYERITQNINRTGDNPSNFTLFLYCSNDKDIASMHVKGGLNAWHLDDMVIGGAPGYIEGDYTYAARNMETLIGAKFLEFGAGYNLIDESFYTAEQIINDVLPYWNHDTKEMLNGQGIYDENAILYAFNQEETVVNWLDINDMAKHDFKIFVGWDDVKPGDVFFIDYSLEDGPDGCYDEIGIVIEPTLDTDGDVVDIIRIIPEQGVHYSTRDFIEALHGHCTDCILDYKRLPPTPKGGHSPYPKIPSKFLT